MHSWISKHILQLCSSLAVLLYPSVYHFRPFLCHVISYGHYAAITCTGMQTQANSFVAHSIMHKFVLCICIYQIISEYWFKIYFNILSLYLWHLWIGCIIILYIIVCILYSYNTHVHAHIKFLRNVFSNCTFLTLYFQNLFIWGLL